MVSKISVIVPTYNSSEYLPRCLDSICNQTHTNLEIIVVSDGPNEDIDIVEQYINKDSRVKLIKNIEKRVGGARNAGLDIATGDFIAFVDADDWIEADAFSQCLKVFNNDIDMVVFGANIVSNGTTITKEASSCAALNFSGIQNAENVLFQTNIHVWNKLWRKEIIDKYNIRFPENMEYEDFPFYFQYLSMAKKVFFLNMFLYNYFQHSSSGMVSTYNHNLDCIKDHINGCYFLYNQWCSNGSIHTNNDIFIKIYAKWILTALSYCNKKDKIKLCRYAYQIFKQMKLSNYKQSLTLRLLNWRRYRDIIERVIKLKHIYLFGCICLFDIKYYESGKMVLYFLKYIPIFKLLSYKMNDD